MVRYSLWFLFLVFASPLGAQDEGVQSAREILENALKRSDIYSAGNIKDFVMSVTLVESRKAKQIATYTLKAKVLKGDKLGKAMVHYTSPAGIKGTSYLAYLNTEKNKPEAIWVYLPSFNKTQRISLYKASRSLPGVSSNLPILDGRKIDFDDYTYSFKAVEDLGQAQVIEIIPKNKKEKHSRNFWVSRETGLISKILTMDRDKRIVEEIVLQSYKANGDYWLPSRVSMTNPEQEKTTELVLEQITLNAGLQLDDFELKQLETVF